MSVTGNRDYWRWAVESTFAYSLPIQGLAPEIVLIDVNRGRAENELMDSTHEMPFAYPTRIWAGQYSDLRGADIVVIAVDKGRKVEQSRLDLAKGNFVSVRSLSPS